MTRLLRLKMGLGRLTYQKKMLLITLFLGLFPVMAVGLASSYIAVSNVQQEVDKNHRMLLAQIEYQLNAFLTDMKTASLQISEDLIVRDSLKVGISRDTFRTTMSMIDSLRKYRSVAKTPFAVSLIYRSFHQVYSTVSGPLSITDRYYKPLVQSLNQGYYGISVITPHTYPNQKDLLIVKPVSIDNAMNGIVVLHVEITKFYEYLHHVDIGSSSALVVDRDGLIVMSPDAEQIGTRLPPASELYAYWRNKEAKSGTASLNGEKFNVSTLKSSLNGWTYIAMTPSGELNRKAADIRRLTWTMMGAILVVWGLISVAGYRKMYSPIRRIQGKLPGAPNKGADIVKEIASYMDDMLETNKRLSSRLFEQLPLVRESVLLRILHGEAPAAELFDNADKHELLFSGEWLTLAIVEADMNNALKGTHSNKARSSLMTELARLVAETAERAFPCLTVSPQSGQVVLIASAGRGEEETNFRRTAAEIGKQIEARFDFTATISIGKPVRRWQDIGGAYQEALALLGFKYMFGPNTIITGKEVEASSAIRSSDRIVAKRHKLAMQSLLEGDVDKAEAHFNEMFDALPGQLPDFGMMMGVLTYFLEEIDQMLLDQHVGSLQSLFDANPFAELHGKQSLSEAREWFGGVFFPAIRQQLRQTSDDKSRTIARETLEYIHDNFDSDFSLQQVAGEFGVSSSQLSRYFKQWNDINFVDYVIHYRISKAKEWLVYTDMSIKDIASRLRYASTQNFTRVFKQICGIPPGQYREDFKQGDK